MKNNMRLSILSISAKTITYLSLFLVALFILQMPIYPLSSEYLKKQYQEESKLVTPPAEPELTEQEKKLKTINGSSREVLPDGTIHLVNKKKHDSEYAKAIYNTKGDIIWEPESREKVPYKYIQWPEHRRDYYADSKRFRRIYDIDTEFSISFIVPVVSENKDKNIILERWQYEPTRDIFTGYDEEGYKIGYMGSNGFSQKKSEASSFGRLKYITGWSKPLYANPLLLLQTKDRLYHVSFKERAVEVIFEIVNDQISYIDFGNWHVSSADAGPYRPMMYILTKSKRHYVLLNQPRKQIELNLPEKFNQSQLSICAYNDDILIRHNGVKGAPSEHERYKRNEWWKGRDFFDIETFMSTYRINENAEPELIDNYDSSRKYFFKSFDPLWKEYLLIMERIRKSISSVSPILYKPARAVFSSWYLQNPENSGDMQYAYFEILEILCPENLGLNCAVSTLMVVLAGLHGWSRRKGWGGYIFWLVFVAAFNLAGLLTYIALKHTVVIRCSGCGRRRGLEREDCPACGLDLPEPARREVDLIGVS